MCKIYFTKSELHYAYKGNPKNIAATVCMLCTQMDNIINMLHVYAFYSLPDT